MSKKRDRKKDKQMSSAQRRAEQHEQGFERTSITLPNDTKMFVIKDSKPKRVDVLNYRVGKGNPWADEGELHYERTFFVHRGIGPNNDSYVCPAKTAKKRCPICEYMNKLDSTDAEQFELAKALYPRERQMFNVMDLESDDPEEVLIWEISFHLFGKKLDARIRNADEDDEYRDFADYEGGSTLKLGVEEKSFGGNSFYEVDSIDFKSRKEDYAEEIEEDTHCLDDLLKILEYDELKEIFEQEEEEEDEKEEKSSSKKKSNKKTSKKKSKKKEADEDEQEEEKSSSKKKTKKTSKKKSSKKKEAAKTTADDDDWGDADDSNADDDAAGDWGDEDGDGWGDNDTSDECPWNVDQRVTADVDGEEFSGAITEVDVGESEAEVTFDDGDVLTVAFANLTEED